MFTLSPILSLLLIVLWVIGIAYCSVKYIRAFREKKRLEKWIWLILWCIFVTFIEWIVYFGMGAVCEVFNVGCSVL